MRSSRRAVGVSPTGVEIQRQYLVLAKWQQMSQFRRYFLSPRLFKLAYAFVWALTPFFVTAIAHSPHPSTHTRANKFSAYEYVVTAAAR